MVGVCFSRAGAGFSTWATTWTAAVAAVLALALSAACSQSPTAPTPAPAPLPPPPVAGPPTLACPNRVLASTTAPAGTMVSYATPEAEGGQTPVTVTCAPASGTLFQIGETNVDCTAKDALDRSASCAFPIVVSRIPQLSRTKFLAFGDSITAGEVTVPVASSGAFGPPSFKQIQVPSAAYPTVLGLLLQARYTAQQDNIAVANYGVGGEKAVNARTRFIEALGIVRPDAVLLMEGSNDIARGEDGAASGAAREIGIMASEARLRGMRVFIATVAPGRAGGSKTIATELLVDYNTRMRAVAHRQGAALVDVYSALLPEVNANIGVDGLHPTEIGYRKIAEAFFAAIRADLETR